MTTKSISALFSGLFLCFCACSPSESVDELQLAEGYEVEMVAGPDLVDYPMFARLDPDGRLFVFESIGNVYETSQQAIDDPQFRIKLLEDLDQDGKYDKATIFADKLSFPQGGVFVDGSLIASSAPDLLKLTDTDGDGVADQREVLLSGWVLNVNANSLIGPFLGPDGWLYMTSAIEGFDVTTREGERMKGETARIWKVRPDGSDLQWVSAGGMNNPIALTFTPAGEVLGTQTFFVDPQRGLRDAITYWAEGGIYGKKSSVIDRDSLPRTGDLLPVVSQYSRVAPVGISYYSSALFGEEFKGNLFSTQFNTHLVMRHQLSREGASFSLSNEPFLWTDNTDFHPTDILEDGDGSLLMVETGGWFILGCPLSQVSKPQLKGAIYRISKQGVDPVSDPYGNQISWESLSIEAVAKYLEDPRGFVSDKAQRALVAAGDQAIGILSEVLEKAPDPKVRVKVLFGLYQIGTEQAIQAILAGFEDQDLEVKLAAARIAGLTMNDVFKPFLSDLLTSPEAPLVRQAATALGQLKAEDAIPHLIQAGTLAKDPFIKHAVTFALINIDRFEPLVAALGPASSGLASMLLMALEFMPSSKLGSDLVLPYLAKDGMSEAALRVATRHPEWSTELVGYLNQRLKAGSFSEQQLNAYQPLITNYCGTKEMQGFLAHLLQTGNSKERVFAMASMGKCAQDPFPEDWKNPLTYLFENSKDANTLAEAVALVKLRGLTEMANHLDRIGASDSYPTFLRISAIEASLVETQKLTEAQFSLLCSQLEEGNSPIIAQQAGRTIASVELSSDQLSYISNSILPSLDPFVLPTLLPAYQRSTDLETGKQLASYLVDLPSLDNFTEDYIQDLFKAYPREIEAHLNPLIQQLVTVREQRFRRIAELEVLASGGSEERGRALYYGKAICSTCHAMQQAGGTLGPDLTSIQKDRSIHDIIEAIVYPSVSFVRDYETYQINTESDDFRGVIKEQTPDMILLETAPGSTVRIPMKEVTSVEQLPVSMMPQGLDKVLTEEEFKDLMAYLLAQDLVY